MHSFARYTLPLNVTRLMKFGREVDEQMMKDGNGKSGKNCEHADETDPDCMHYCHTSFLDPIAVAATSGLCQ